ncbi:MAG: hypothetical protein ACI4OU_04450 [Candidatus Enterenecus sp.]
MKKLLRGALLGVLAGLMCALMAGCGLFKPVDSLYSLPALPEEYSQLQKSIQAVMDELGAEYASISYGSNTSIIQLLDMDGNGDQETAAVFLRVPGAEEKPLRVCLFHRGDDGSYQLTHTLQGDGLYIYSVAYVDLTGDGMREIIVSWQLSTRVYALSAYQITPTGANELMNTSYNERYLATDFDEDGHSEILVFQQHSTEGESNRAEYYRYQDGIMTMVSAAPLSDSMVDVTGARAGRLSDGTLAVYVTCDAENGVLTDILVLDQGNLRNVTRDSERGVSLTTLRAYTDVSATDINRDGVLEIPLPMPAPSLNPDNPSSYYFIYWRQFDSSGTPAVVSATYHSTVDGWYFTLPNSWTGKITVGRDDSRSFRGERAVIFYYWPNPEEGSPLPFLTIYRLTGDNRFSRANGRTILYSDSSTIYCATLNTGNWNCGLTAGELAQYFSLITTEWSSQ